MHIGILFYSDTLASLQNTKEVKGRAVANHQFIKALVANSSSHRLSFFISSAIEKEYFLENLKLKESDDLNVVTFLDLERYLQENHVDVIHSLGPDLYRGIQVRQSVARYPLAVTGITHSLGHAPFLEWLHLNALFQPQVTDALICTTPTAQKAIESMAQAMKPHWPAGAAIPTSIIPLGVETLDFKGHDRSLRQAYSIPDDAVVSLYLGRFSYYTKVDLLPLLLTFRQLRQKTKRDVRLVLAGAPGSESYPTLLQAAIQEYGIQDAVTLVSAPDEPTKKKLYQMADIFVAPGDNYQETFGITILEAMASGLPVLASDWDGYQSLIQEGVTGYRIPTLGLETLSFLEKTSALQLDSLNALFFSQGVATDFGKWTGQWAELIEDEKRRREMGAGARQAVEAYDWSAIIRQYLDLWQRLVTQANNVGLKSPQTPSLPYQHAFGSYLTGVLKENDRLSLSELGQEALKGDLPIRLYTAMEEILSVPLMGEILKQAQGVGTVSAAVQKLSPSFKDDVIRYHIVWLAKYGLVQVN